MKTTERILGLIAALGIIMKLLFIPGRGFALVIGFSGLSLFYYVLSFAYFNNIPLRDIFKKASYKGISALRIIGIIVLGFSLSTAAIAILFTFQSYPGATFMLWSGVFFLLVCFIIAFIRSKRNNASNYRKIFSRIIIMGGFALLLSLIPKMILFEILHRDHPAYVQAVKNLYTDPHNKEFQDEVKRQKELIYGKQQ